MGTNSDSVWEGAYKIPWDDPEFSRRMLHEHLSQDHDLASRRTPWIARQVAWLHQHLLDSRPSRILDLCCGPGFYAHRLAALGHACRGIDFGPASIDYARRHATAGADCAFSPGDIRHVGFGGPYELAMILYGELNAFQPAEAAAILAKVRASLSPAGRVVLELQSAPSVEALGRAAPVEQDFASSLFSDHPHRCRTEHRWLPDCRVTVQTFLITDACSGHTRAYRNTTQAWPDDALADLLDRAGFVAPHRCAGWPSNTDALGLWAASRP